MGYLNINPDLFLEVAELQRLKQFIDDSGFRKNLLENTVKFGLIKNKYNDPVFSNARVERDLDTAVGQKTIKVREIFGVDNLGQFLHKAETGGLPVPNDGNWYWIKIAHTYTSNEMGSFTVSGNGDLVDVSGTGELTKILRGFPNFPVRVSFENSQYNTLQYDVLEVIDNQHATIQQPATNSNGISQFVPEDGLILKVVGTFTPGIAVPAASQFIYNYDSVTISLVQENLANKPPTDLVADLEFYIARIKVASGTVIIQDKRNQFWETKGSELPLTVERKVNPCIGVESIQFNNLFSAGDENIVQLAWGMRSNNWSVDSSNNVVTFNSGEGGRYKTVNDFNNGDFDGWRLYTPSGNYFKILSSVKQGSAINFVLDTLDIDQFSGDGGSSFFVGYLTAVPDCESVEIKFAPNTIDNEGSITRIFAFPVNELTGRCDVLVYRDPSVLYNVQYRYKSFKEFTAWIPIPTDIVNGYLNESSFDGTDNLRPSDQRSLQKYTSDPVNGFILLNLSPNSLKKFRNKVDKGDIIGVTNITDLSLSTVINLTVGLSNNYVYISGSPTLENDIYFVLDSNNAVEGNEFRIHFDCIELNLNGFHIYIVRDSSAGTVIKEVKQGDFYGMRNQEGGITFDLKFNGTKWVFYQNYDLGRPNELVYIDGLISAQFDNAGFGKVRGLFGHFLCNQSVTINGIVIPNLKNRFLLGVNSINPVYVEGQSHGSETHTLSKEELPSDGFSVPGITGGDNNDNNNEDKFAGGDKPDGQGQHFSIPVTGGGDVPFSIMPPYYSTIICKKLY